jgi:hypothetical protein
VQEDKVMQNAVAEEEEHKQQEAAADNKDEYLDIEVDDYKNPKTTTKGNVALIEALLAGTALSNPLVPLNVSIKAGLSEYESVISYKNGLGKVGIICNTEIKGWPVYRIRRGVVFSENVLNIIKGRRAGTLKDEKARTKWGWFDALTVKGIAIAVLSGYKGNAEDLVLLVKRYLEIERKEMKDVRKPIPKQLNVQVLIE